MRLPYLAAVASVFMVAAIPAASDAKARADHTRVRSAAVHHAVARRTKAHRVLAVRKVRHAPERRSAEAKRPITPPPAKPAPAPPPPTPLPSPVPSTQTEDIVNNAKLDDDGVKDGISPAILRAQVMLDRLHASPGVIDGRDGLNFSHALVTFEKSKHLPPVSALNPKVWSLLVKESGGPVLTQYVLTDKDVEGPFFPDLPRDYAKLAKLPTLGYRNVSQKLGAKFHMSEDLLGALNPGVDLSKPGTRILVADVQSAPIHGDAKIVVVDKKTSQVLAYDPHGRLMAVFPATIGSRELPSPSGTYRVKGVAWNPIYYYDPQKNFVQGDNKEKLKLPPGPNNPVGSVFIALTKPTYGLHGTPDPSMIDKTVSHGCVRMTNWDASELAHLVRPGTTVTFRR